ncbi:MAG: phenylalanine--tRNA ligase subunit alpha [Syntrophobacterales bacterium]|nr:phenylalanine--tRNA ligase subunit alpha [Syntrophobacterales bacterium]
MREQLEKLQREAEQELLGASTDEAIQAIRTKYLGRKGMLTSILRGLASVPPEERPAMGQLANQVKESLSQRIDAVLEGIEASKKDRRLMQERVDVTLPGRGFARGTLHPITQVTQEICGIFAALGFAVAEGPEVELDYYNFEALNMAKDHPSRDMQATFYITENLLLRTHTSPVQVRVMEKQQPPVRVIAPGKVYRPDADISHSPMFHQIEGLYVDRKVTFGDLKGTLTYFLHHVFGSEVGVRFRPSFFPFTEPSAEVDIQCVMCRGKGCRVCGQSGWLEILGSGMVDPEVFKAVGYDSEQYTGFAFGLGVERIAMLRYGISDIRLFTENDRRFLEQF